MSQIYSRKFRLRHARLMLMTAVALVPLTGAYAAVTWNGASGLPWNAAANWTPAGIPAPTADLLFLATGVANTFSSRLFDNTLISTVHSLLYTTTTSSSGSGAASFTTTLDVPLTVSSTAGGDVFAVLALRSTFSNTTVITGSGTLNVAARAGNFRVCPDQAPSGGTNTLLTLDLTGLNRLTVDVNHFYVGLTANGSAFAGGAAATTLLLPTAGSATIAASAFSINAGSSGSLRPATVKLGTSTTLMADTILVGAGLSNGSVSMQFQEISGGTLTIRGRSGLDGSAANLSIGVGKNSDAINAPSASLDLSSHAALGGLDLAFGAVTVGFGYFPASFSFAAPGDSTSRMTAASITVGGNTYASGSGTLSLNGGRTTCTGVLALAPSGSGAGRLYLRNAAALTAGSLTLGGSGCSGELHIADSASLTLASGGIFSAAQGRGTSRLTLVGGSLDLAGNDMGTPTSPLTYFTFTGGSLLRPGNLYVRNFFGPSLPNKLELSSRTLAILSPAGGDAYGTINASGLALNLSSGTLQLSGTASTDAFRFRSLTLSNASLCLDMGNGLTDALQFDSLDLSGVTRIQLTTTGTLTPGVFPLLSFRGSPRLRDAAPDLASCFQLVDPAVPGYSFALVGAPDRLDLVVASPAGWTGAASARWHTAANWAGVLPNAPGVLANFSDPSAPGTVDLDAPATLGTLVLNRPGGCAITGAASLVFAAADAPAFLVACSADHVVATPLELASVLHVAVHSTLTLNGSITGAGGLVKTGEGRLLLTGSNAFAGGATLAAGTLAFSSLAALGAHTLSLRGGTLQWLPGNTHDLTAFPTGLSLDAPVRFDPDVNSITFAGRLTGSGSLIKTGSSSILTLAAPQAYTGGTCIEAGLLVIASHDVFVSLGLLHLNAVDASAGGRLALRGGASFLDECRRKLALGFGAGRWDGSDGITSDTAQVAPGTLPTHGIGYLTVTDWLGLRNAAFFPAFALSSPDDLLLQYTWMGDADLSGSLTPDDYAQLDAGFLFGQFDALAAPADWAHGDFNYDGRIDYLDYALIDAAYAAQSGSLASDLIAAHAIRFGDPYLAVLRNGLPASFLPIPEPRTLSLLLFPFFFIRLLRRAR